MGQGPQQGREGGRTAALGGLPAPVFWFSFPCATGLGETPAGGWESRPHPAKGEAQPPSGPWQVPAEASRRRGATAAEARIGGGCGGVRDSRGEKRLRLPGARPPPAPTRPRARPTCGQCGVASPAGSRALLSPGPCLCVVPGRDRGGAAPCGAPGLPRLLATQADSHGHTGRPSGCRTDTEGDAGDRVLVQRPPRPRCVAWAPPRVPWAPCAQRGDGEAGGRGAVRRPPDSARGAPCRSGRGQGGRGPDVPARARVSRWLHAGLCVSVCALPLHAQQASGPLGRGLVCPPHSTQRERGQGPHGGTAAPGGTGTGTPSRRGPISGDSGPAAALTAEPAAPAPPPGAPGPGPRAPLPGSAC